MAIAIASGRAREFLQRIRLVDEAQVTREHHAHDWTPIADAWLAVKLGRVGDLDDTGLAQLPRIVWPVKTNSVAPDRRAKQSDEYSNLAAGEHPERDRGKA